MLTRLYLDNFRCFENFEFKPGPLQVILGANGTGKSSFVDALRFLRRFIVDGVALDDLRPLSQRTRWLRKAKQTFEIEVQLGGQSFRYRLEIEAKGNPARARVGSESLIADGEVVFAFENGVVTRYPPTKSGGKIPRQGRASGIAEALGSTRDVSYEADDRRSALATSPHRFKTWFENLYCFRLDPFRMGSRAPSEALHPAPDLSNIAAWYRGVGLAFRREDKTLLRSLADSIDGFEFLRFQPIGEGVSVLQAEFARTGKFNFKELSDGQRCLIALYMILHFIVAKGGAVVIDEPENFISLREIQPWLMSVRDAAEEAKGQILLISHHPEIMNQWAPENGVLFVRDETGAVSPAELPVDPDSALTVSELIARGWEN